MIGSPGGFARAIVTCSYWEHAPGWRRRAVANRISLQHELAGVTPEIAFDDLEECCGGFRIRSRLGGGAFGNVYKGAKPDGTAIAVKVLSHSVAPQDFRREASMMSKCRRG